MEDTIAPATRKAVLDRRRRAKMATSAHTYVRGNTVQFCEWLRRKSVQASIPAGPEIWICGHCHTGNLGPVADILGNIDIQKRDLNQTVIANPAHDFLRLGPSLEMAAWSSDLPRVTTALTLEEMIGGYQSGLTLIHPQLWSRLSSLIVRNSDARADVGRERRLKNSLMMNPRNAKGPLFRVEPLGVEFGASPECPVPWGARGTGG